MNVHCMEDGKGRSESGKMMNVQWVGGMRELGTKRDWFLPQSLLSCTTSSDWSVCGVSSGGGREAR